MILLIFWLTVSILIYIYIGYPITLYLISIISSRKLASGIFYPTVTILIPAYNEEDAIAKTIENKLSLTYPTDRLSIYVISDGSIDRTERIVEEYAAKGIKLIKQSPRKGKTAALNSAISQVTSDIIVFSDANSLYTKDALVHLVKNFSEPSVGYVTGKMIYINPDYTTIGDGCTMYMKYENMLRVLETRCGSIVGVDGGIDAVRRTLFEPLPEDALPDFVLPLKVIEKGYRVVYEPLAILKEEALSKPEDEYSMRVRVSLRAFHAMHLMKHLFNPLKYNFFSFQLLVHKLLRYLVSLLLLVLFVLNLLIVTYHPLYTVILILQSLFYILVAVGYILPVTRKHAMINIPFYFFLINFSSLLGFIKFCLGVTQITWEPRKG